ncbi:ATP-dependent RNA helicase DDX23/PRP28, partial [Haematococcus lacustris]
MLPGYAWLQPLSLEELLKRKRQQQEEEAKPKFLSKKEREAQALQRLAAQRAALMHLPLLAFSKWQEERERERELEMIKQQYLGMNKLKKRVIRPSEKYKFNFEWGAEEDTSKDLNPLYANPH